MDKVMHQSFEPPPSPTSEIGRGQAGMFTPVLTIFYGPGVRGLHYCFISLPLEAGTYPRVIQLACTTFVSELCSID